MFLLHNKAVSDEPGANEHVRQLVLKRDVTGQLAMNNVELAAFFDAYDDGTLDILVVADGKINAFQNNLGVGATWIKC